MRYVSSAGHSLDRRPGVVLLVVMAMLALFASLALSFVFYADAEAIASRLNMDSMVKIQPDIDTEELMGFFLKELLYGSDNALSAMRGWEMARSIYGYNPKELNFTPYNGVGRGALNSPDPDFTGVYKGVPYMTTQYNMVNYQPFHDPTALATDPTVNFVRTPEFFGKVHFAPNATPPTPTSSAVAPKGGFYGYQGGANPPWTAYDTNSLFLAQVDSAGNVWMPSFSRPWLAGSPTSSVITVPNNMPAPKNSLQAKLAKYMTLFPDSQYTNPAYSTDPTHVWNPLFVLPDNDGTADVRNLEFGPAGTSSTNDSKWMDLGFPVMTAPNGKRYKALFAPLVMDLSNRLHLWAHGNRLGVSSMGYGPSEVNLSNVPGFSVAINTATEGKKGGIVTITTGTPHYYNVGQAVVISGVPVAGYNGIYQITAVPTAQSFQYVIGGKGLAASGGGTAMNGEIFQLRYGGQAGTAASVPVGTPQNFNAGITPLMPFDADGLDPNTNLSSNPFQFGFTTTSSTTAPKNGGAVLKIGVNTITLTQVSGISANGFNWGIMPGMTLNYDTGINQEPVVVTAVSPAANTITATFKKKHAAGVTVSYGIAALANLVAPPGSVPATSPIVTGQYYANGYGNYNVAEQTNNPLALNLYTPVSPNLPPMPTSNLESLLRWGGTNSPALTSDIVRRMPYTFYNRNLPNSTRNMVTLASWHMDRVTSSPFLNFNRATAGHYQLNGTNTYPQLQAGKNPAPTYGTPASVTTSTYKTTPPWDSEFSTDWRSNIGNFLRVDLTRPLTSYAVSDKQALADRQELALDLYEALVRVTGAQDPNTLKAAAINVNSGDYQAARWLAQLAVNIVDYIDNDGTPGSEAMTAFKWFTGATVGKGKGAKNIPAEYVFGTEAPALVLNEVYVQQENSPNGQINVWAELLNPLQNGNAVLQNNAGPVYRIEVYNSPLPNGNAAQMALANNNLGTGPGGLPLAIVGWVATDPNTFPKVAWTPSSTTAQTNLITTKVTPVNGGSAAPALVQTNINPENKNAALTGAKQAGATVTLHTTAPHGLTKANVGTAITVTGVTNAMGAPQVGYDGTFVVTGVPANNMLTYTAAVGGLPHGGGGKVSYYTNANSGYYVVGPAEVGYANVNRVPNLEATLATNGLSFMPPVVNIEPFFAKKKKAKFDGATTAMVGGVPTATITLLAPATLPASFGNGTPGDPYAQVIINGVANAGYNNNTGANPLSWQITNINAARNSFQFAVPALLPDSGGGTATLSVQKVTLLLRRLADPNLPYQNNPLLAKYNPFVTVDYVDPYTVTVATTIAAASNGVPLKGAATINVASTAGFPPQGTITVATTAGGPYTVAYTGITATSFTGCTEAGAAGNMATGGAVMLIKLNVNPIQSYGRTQPYSATLPATASNSNFFSQNSPGTTYDVLVHLDRPPVNPLELLFVSGYKPHLLTQQFVVSNGGVNYKQQHYAPWNPYVTNSAGNSMADPSALIYRALDHMSSHYMAGLYTGGRFPGNINLNTLMDANVFNALCDAPTAQSPQHPNAWFTSKDVGNAFTALVAARGFPNNAAPTIPTNPAPPLPPNPNAYTDPTMWVQTATQTPTPPFKSFAAAKNTGGNVDFSETLFRTNSATNRPLFAVGTNTVVGTTPANHPYVQASLLQKIYNNITTTSNVFAVWWTVGYFEVVDETVQPPRLGQEIGRSQNSNIRHRFFAVVDRSGMQIGQVNSATKIAITGDAQVLPMTFTPGTASNLTGNAAVWSAAQNYLMSNIVTDAGQAYVCIQPNYNKKPTAPVNAAYWQTLIQPGMLLEIDSGANAEVVAVETVAGTTFTAEFTKSHAAGVPIVIRGNPGPQANYSPHKDTGVVLHMSVIK